MPAENSFELLRKIVAGEDPYVVREYRHEDDAFTTQNGAMRVGPGPNGVRR